MASMLGEFGKTAQNRYAVVPYALRVPAARYRER